MKMKILLKSLLPALALAASTLLCPAQITNVNIGSVANDGTGDPLRLAFQKLNSNFLYMTVNYTATNDTRSLNFNNAANQFNGTFLGSMAYANLTGGPVMSGYLTNAMTGGKIWVGNSGNTAALVALSGDATLGNTGALTLANTSQARTDLGLGSAATLAATAFLQPGNNLSDVGNAPTSLANLGGMSLTGSNVGTASIFMNGGSLRLVNLTLPNSGLAVFFDATTSQTGNQPIIMNASPYSSGASIFWPVKMTNAFGPVDARGYYNFDQFGGDIEFTGLQATNSNLPGVFVMNANYNEASANTTAESVGNIPHWFTMGGTNGDLFEVGYADGIVGHIYPVPVGYWVGTTNVFNQPANMPKLFEVNQNAGTVNIYNPTNIGGLQLVNGALMKTTNGTIIKANGTLNTGAAFDSTDSTASHLDSSRFFCAQVFAFTGGTSLASGPLNVAVAADGSGMYYDPNNFFMQLGCTIPQIAMAKSTQSANGSACVGIGGSELATKSNWQDALLTVNGSIAQVITGFTSGPSLGVTNGVTLLTATGQTATLPDATSNCRGRIYTIKLKATGSGTVATTSSQTIDGSTTYSLSAVNKYVTVISDGTNWSVIGGN